jgi:hypothetical protein
MNEIPDQHGSSSSPPITTGDAGTTPKQASVFENPRVTRFLLGLAAGVVFALVLVHMYQIATGTLPAGKMEMVEREESPVEIALMLTSLVVWPLIGLLPRRLFLIGIGAGAGCVAGYFLAWAMAGVRFGDPLWLEYQIGIREWMPTTIPLGAVVGAVLGLALGMKRGRDSRTAGNDTIASGGTE